MPEDSKKHDKKKNDPKEQRRPRQQRHQPSVSEKKPEKKTEELKNTPQVPLKPAYESPPPEFYKNLKRETDEILKITEEENTKYKKKEIQSNWSKYEMPIESYDEIEEQENLGADYEKLIQAPLSIGGHFQFKHEKSWDMNTGPSVYDKYFEINMEDLNIALCTIPFYERNLIEQSRFSQTDLLTMNNRSTRFKQKYYNDKSYSTPETEAQDKILNNLRESMKDNNSTKGGDTLCEIEIKYDKDNGTDPMIENKTSLVTDVNLEFKNESKTEHAVNVVDNDLKENTFNIEALSNETEPIFELNIEKAADNIENNILIFGNENKPNIEVTEVETPNTIEQPVCDNRKVSVGDNNTTTSLLPTVPKAHPVIPKVADTPVETTKNLVIESPEDLEKWLDDFLDG